MHVAGSERASFQIPELVEHEERMVAGAAEMSGKRAPVRVRRPAFGPEA
jgi:hypothetical protein